jgi:sugar/nucleoside kinase (ribokinase family)
MIDALAIASGHPYLDLIFTGLPQVPGPGQEVKVVGQGLTFVPGGSLTSAIILARLGYRVAFETQLGHDFASRFLIEAMQAEGLLLDAVNIVADARACVTVAFNQGNDRSFLSYEHPTPPPNPEWVRRFQPRAVLIDGLPETGPVIERTIETLRVAARQGALRLADAQDLAPTLAVPGVRELLGCFDMITFNEREARHLTGCDDLAEALNILQAIVPVIVLKKGALGALARWAGRQVELPAIPTTVVDLTGCGDNFFAAFGAAMLEGCDMVECLAWGNAAGSLAAAAPGGTTARYGRRDLTAIIGAGYGKLPEPDPLASAAIASPTE